MSKKNAFVKGLTDENKYIDNSIPQDSYWMQSTGILQQQQSQISFDPNNQQFDDNYILDENNPYAQSMNPLLNQQTQNQEDLQQPINNFSSEQELQLNVNDNEYSQYENMVNNDEYIDESEQQSAIIKKWWFWVWIVLSLAMIIVGIVLMAI